MSVIDVGTLAVTAVDVGASPRGLASDGAHIYVANSADGTVTVIDAATHAVVETLDVAPGAELEGVVFAGDSMYVSNRTASAVVPIAIATRTVGTPVSVGGSPSGMTFDGQRVYVANRGASSISVVDAASGVVVTTISSPQLAFVRHLAFDGRYVYATRDASGVSVLAVIDPQRPNSANPVAELGLLGGSRAWAVEFDGTNVWVVSQVGDVLSKLWRF